MSVFNSQIAIVGLGCRFPGATNAVAFWELLAKGVDAVVEIPDERWALSGNVSTSLPKTQWWAGLADNIAAFDASFFGISPHEARLMDPQQRLLLEVAWEAFESAGIPRETLAGSRTGVFVGISTFDYGRLQAEAVDAKINAHSSTGNALSIAANRISYFLDLHGPSLAVDTACSSSLVSVHLAVESLQRGECDLALAGGVNAILDPKFMAVLADAGMLAPDGRCKTFDARANGYVRGEGCGMVVLKRLEQAIADRDPIIAIIKGSAVNQDGKSNGLTAPNGLAQEAVIREALAAAEVAPHEVDYVEAHGTGTSLGDPIEVFALHNVLGQGRDAQQRWLTGSVKTNIGHLEAAAGVASLIKTALALKQRVIPPSLHFREANPQIPFARLSAQVVTERSAWPQRGRANIAGVSSFGFGGTNAHVILQEASPLSSTSATNPAPYLFALSAHNETALQQRLQDLHTWLAQAAESSLADLAYTLTTRRSHFNHRLACVARDRGELLAVLDTVAQGGKHPLARRGLRKPAGPAPLVWVYSGQGAHYPAMGASLYVHEAVFRETFDACEAALRAAGGPSLLAELTYGAETPAEVAGYSQPALVAVQISLTALWQHWGIQADAVVGHSLGEISAAWAAGILSLNDAMRLAWLRHNAMQAQQGLGAMLSVTLPPEQTAEILTPWGGMVCIAAINSPNTTVVSGALEAIEELAAEFERLGVDYRRVRTDYAFHSPQMAAARDELRQGLTGLSPQTAQLPFYSTLHGRQIEGRELDAAYWGEQARQPVQFAAATTALAQEGYSHFLEIGGHPVLAVALQESVAAVQPSYTVLASLRRGVAERAQLFNSLASLYAEGFNSRWQAIYPTGNCVELPPMRWQHERYWFTESAPTTSAANTSPAAPVGQERAAILDDLRESVASILGVPPDGVDIYAPFIEMGADSILLAQAAQRIRTQYGVDVGLRKFFEELGTLDALAGYLAEHAVIAPAAPVVTNEPVATTPTIEVSAPATPQPAPARSGDSNLLSLFDRQLEAMSELLRKQLEVLGQQSATLTPNAVELSSKVSVPPFAKGGAGGISQPTYKIPLDPHFPKGEATALTPTPPAAKRDFGPYRPPRLSGQKTSGFTPQQQVHLDAFTARYTARTPTSKSLAKQWRKHYADCRASAGFRPSVKEMLYPIVGARAEGARLWDVDGNAYLDVSMDFGVNLFGHRAPFIEAALLEQIQNGTALSARSAHAGEVAALLCELTGMDRVVFCQSGSEAVMSALRLARLVTGRNRVAYFSHAYHGHFDGVLGVALEGIQASPAAPGIAPSMVADALVLPYGEEQALAVLREHGTELAAVLVEPVQSRHPELQPAAFLRELRELTRQSGTVLIFDEMITGFRVHPGGAQAWFGVQADLATYGKVLGGGQPLAAVAGRRELMDGFDGGHWDYGDASYPQAETTFFAGTYSGNPLALAAAKATLSEIKRLGPALQQGINAKTERLASGLNAWFVAENVPIRIVHFGSLFRFTFTGNLDLLFFHLLEKGVFVWEGRNCFLSAAHSDDDVDVLQARIKASVEELRAGGFLPGGAPRAVAVNPEPAQPLAIPVTEAQRQLWILAQIDELANQAYSETIIIRAQGRLDPELFRRAFQTVIDRHEALRTTFSADGRSQIIHLTARAEFHQVDASALQGAELERERTAFMEHMSSRPFDLTTLPLARLGLFRLTGDSQLIVVVGHHIILDGWSINLLVNDLAVFYSVELGQLAPPPPVKVQYRDYVAWLEQSLTEPAIVAQGRFWHERLQWVQPDLGLYHDQPKPTRWTWHGARLSSRIGKSLRGRLEQVGRSQGATLFMVLLAAYQTFLHRLSNQTDLIVGCPVLGRNGMPDGMKVIGYMTHLLPMRSRLKPHDSFAAFLKTTRGEVLDALDHQDFPFAQMIRGLDRSWNPDEPALVRVTFNLDRPREGPSLTGLRCELLAPEVSAAKFELGLNVIDLHGELLLEWDYNRDLFSKPYASFIQEHFVEWLRQLSETPEQPLAVLPFGDTRVWAATPVNRLADDSLYAAFKRQAALTPDAVCVIAAHEQGDPQTAPRLTYRQLHARAAGLAQQLRSLDLGAEPVVGLATQRGLERIIGVLGILAAGGAYLPLDPEYPAERLAFMLRDCGTGIVVSDEASRPAVAELALAQVLTIDSREAEDVVEPVTTAQRLAYVMFTSGSTGTPKGVAVTQRNVLSFIAAMAARDDAPDGPMLHHSPIAFDASTLEIWWPLLTGRPLVLAPTGALGTATLARCLRDYGIQDIFLPTGLFNRLVEHEANSLAGLGRIMSGGSVASALHFGQSLERAESLVLLNGYGPTECTTFAALHLAQPEDCANHHGIPIGQALPGLRLYVLDRYLEPVPPNMPGELYIGGPQVARGYYNRPALTAERFLPDPFSSEPGAVMYRTGDRVLRRADGVYEYLERLDQQVKIHGYRVELGEVEAALRTHAAIGDALAGLIDDGAGGQQLVAGLLATGPKLNTAALREFLREHLPVYMIPAQFAYLEQIPLDANGKPDRKALRTALAVSDVVADDAPLTATEQRLAAIWSRLLKREGISRQADFFALGGHSLLAAELVGEIASEFAVTVPLRDIFAHASLAACAVVIEQHLAQGETATSIPKLARPRRPAQRVLEESEVFAQ